MNERLYRRVISAVSPLALFALLMTGCVAPVPAAAPAADGGAESAAPAPAEASAENTSVTIGMNELVTSLDPPTDWATSR
jgi:hypothetical protein